MKGQEGDGADGDAGETNEVRNGMGRLKAGGWKEQFVMLACDLWKFILWFLAGVGVRNTGCHCLCLALICGVTVKHQTQTYFSCFLCLGLCPWLFCLSSPRGLPLAWQTVFYRGGSFINTEIKDGKFLCKRSSSPLCLVGQGINTVLCLFKIPQEVSHSNCSTRQWILQPSHCDSTHLNLLALFHPSFSLLTMKRPSLL